jgi:hypothetical protein
VIVFPRERSGTDVVFQSEADVPDWILRVSARGKPHLRVEAGRVALYSSRGTVRWDFDDWQDALKMLRACWVKAQGLH